MAIKHAKTSAIGDGADTTLVRPSDWNADHIGLTIVRKTADGDPVNNSTTLVSDPALFLTVAANEVWDIIISFTMATTAVADFKYVFTVPTNGVIYKPAATAQDIDATIAVSVAFGTNRTMATLIAEFRYIGGSGAGNVQFQWAQNTAEVSDTKVLANSFIIAHKLG